MEQRAQASPGPDRDECSGTASTPGPAGGQAASPASVARSHFKTREVVELLDLSRRQLQYWAKTGLVEPSERTPGGHHRYSFDDLVALKATKRLLDAGVSVQKIRASVQALRALLPQVERPLSELVLVATGDVVLVFRDDVAFEAISGQEWVFEVAGFEREVERYRRGDRPRKAKAGGAAAPVVETPAKPGPRKSATRHEPGRSVGRAG